MKKLVLFHNPKSGDAEHDRDMIIKMLETGGYQVRYYNMKKDWKAAELNSSVDLIVVAGGDGTSRKLAGWLIRTGYIKLQIPITILPLGTANNLSKSLGIDADIQELIPQWANWQNVKYDIGVIGNQPAGDETLYFLEALGCGLFVTHLQNNQKGSSGIYKDDPEKKIAADLEKLRQGLLQHKPVDAELMIDGKDYSGNYLMVSVMNSRHLGTNLDFNPGLALGDGLFDVVMIPANQKDLLEEFILNHINGVKKKIHFNTVTGSAIRLRSSDHIYHLDDDLYHVVGGTDIEITANKDQLVFLSPRSGRNGNE